MMGEVFVNKVANSGLITLDLENYIPKEEIIVFDIGPHLFMGLILKEKDFRESLKKIDWSQYELKNVAIVCSVDAIIPVWAYMLLAAYLEPVAKHVYTGTADEMYKYLFLKNIEAISTKEYKDQRLVIKGCGDIPIGNFAYAAITAHLRSAAKSIMYGEPCSTVPIFKTSSAGANK